MFKRRYDEANEFFVSKALTNIFDDTFCKNG